VSFESALYQQVIRPVLFTLTRHRPEWAHSASTPALRLLGALPSIETKLLGRDYYLPRTDALRQDLWGLTFDSPLGVAAGEDKNYQRLRGWYRLGAGWESGGTTTFHRRAGNPGKRIWRYPDGSLMNALGFNNRGLARLIESLGPWNDPWYGQKPNMPVIGSFSISSDTRPKLVELELRFLVAYLHPYVDILEFNPASPNTPELRQLLEKDRLSEILAVIQDQNQVLEAKPLWLKVDPDRTWEQYSDILTVANDHQVAAIVATNTSNDPALIGSRDGKGGVSGPPLERRANDVLCFLYKEGGNNIPLVGIGGAGGDFPSILRKLGNGAILIGFNTAPHSYGWSIFRDYSGSLAGYLETQGATNVSELVGMEELREIS